MFAHQLPIGFTIMNKAYRKLLKSKDFYKKSEKSLHFSSSLGTKWAWHQVVCAAKNHTKCDFKPTQSLIFRLWGNNCPQDSYWAHTYYNSCVTNNQAFLWIFLLYRGYYYDFCAIWHHKVLKHVFSFQKICLLKRQYVTAK